MAHSLVRSDVAHQQQNIILVHGAFTNGAVWRPLYSILKRAGYRVSVVGHSNMGLNADLATTKHVLDRQQGPVILVGHSYGGAIITLAGNEPIVAGLVYLSALAPGEGESLGAILGSGLPDPRNGILPPKDGFVWYDIGKFHSGFCADCPVDLADFMAHSQVPLAESALADSIKRPAWRSKPSWFGVATKDHTIAADSQRFMARRANARTTEIEGSHLCIISQPERCAAIIEDAARFSYLDKATPTNDK